MAGIWKEVVRLTFKGKRFRALQVEELKLTDSEIHFERPAVAKANGANGTRYGVIHRLLSFHRGLKKWEKGGKRL